MGIALPNRDCAAVAPIATASFDFHGDGLLMEADSPARDKLEMFNSVGYVNFVAANANFIKSFVEFQTSRADKRFACYILFVARLLSDQHYWRRNRTLPKNGLCGCFPEMASAAIAGFGPGGLEFC
jgi:hypothetical protein